MLANANHDQVVQAIPVVLEQLPGWSNVSVVDVSNKRLQVAATILGREVKLSLTTGALPLDALDADGLPVGTVAAWLSPKFTKTLRDKGQSYMDTAGNIFFNFPGVYIFRESDATPLVDLHRKRPLGETFSPTATRVGLHLLMDAGLVRATLRDIAALTDVSLPSVKLAIDAFKSDGYILDAGKRGGKQFVNREQFFAKWVEGYNERLRSKLLLGRFSKGVPEIMLDEGNACWGGDQATKTFAQGLRSDEAVVYVYGMAKSVIMTNRLRPDPQGDVTLLQSAWKQHGKSEPMVAPVFVVYADLINTHDPRCGEIAQQLLEQKIRGMLSV